MNRLSWPRVTLLAVVVATLAAWPMLAAGWDEDEVFLVGAASGTSPWMNTRFDAYRFSSGDPAEVAARVESAAFPWYVASDFKYALFRPLTSAVLWLDHVAFGGARVGYQLDALAWHAALVLLAAMLLRRTVPGRVGQGALVLFATSVVHSTPTGWLSARHVLVAGVFGLLGVVFHRRWRDDGRGASGVAAPVAFALALAASEAAVQMLAYVVAFELCRKGTRRSRALALAPTGIVVALYLVLYATLGRGHAYAAPFGGATAFVREGVPRLFAHAAVLLGLSVRPDNAWGYDALRWTMLAAVPLVLLARPALRGLGDDERGASGWLVLGAALSLVPIMGAPLESRVLLAPSLGVAVLAAAVIALGVRAWRERGPARFVVMACASLVFVVHGVVGPVELPRHYAAMARERARRLEAFVRAPLGDLSEVDAFVVGAPHFLYGQLGGYLRARVTGDKTRHWVALADANCAHRLTRVSDARVAIEPMCDPAWLPYGRLAAGDEVRQVDWTVAVTGGHPTPRFELRLPASATVPRFAFVTFEGFTPRRFALPPVGGSVVLPEAAPPDAIDGPTRWLHARFGP